MVGIEEAVTKELESEYPFENLVTDHYDTFISKHLVFFTERTLGGPLLEMRNCSSEFVLFSHHCISKTLRGR